MLVNLDVEGLLNVTRQAEEGLQQRKRKLGRQSRTLRCEEELLR